MVGIYNSDGFVNSQSRKDIFHNSQRRYLIIFSNFRDLNQFSCLTVVLQSCNFHNSEKNTKIDLQLNTTFIMSELWTIYLLFPINL